MSPVTTVNTEDESEEEQLILLISLHRSRAVKTLESTSAFLTPLAEFQLKPTLVAETTQCSLSIASSLDQQLVVLGSPTSETQTEDKGLDSNISCLIDTETKVEVDTFHKKLKFCRIKFFKLRSLFYLYLYLLPLVLTSTHSASNKGLYFVLHFVRYSSDVCF